MKNILLGTILSASVLLPSIATSEVAPVAEKKNESGIGFLKDPSFTSKSLLVGCPDALSMSVRT